MTNLRFPFQRLPDDLGLMVVKTMEHHEIIAYSLTSKKALSMVKSLRIPLEITSIKIGLPQIRLNFRHIVVVIKLRMSEDDEEMTSLEDIPISTNVSNKKRLLMTDPKTMEIYRNFVPVSLTWSNQGKSIGQWIQHIYSIFRCDWYEADISIGNITFDIQSLRIIFPKLIKIKIYCLTAEPNEHNVQNAQIVLRAFLPYVKDVDLFSVPFQENLSLQHFGMVNLRNLMMYQPPSMNFGDIFTWNADYSTFHTNRFSMRDMNRFFKLWTKGSFPRLGGWRVYGVINVDLSVLLKGIRPKKERKLEAEGAERELEFIIQNCHGTLAEIRIYNNIRTNASVHFAVSSSR